MAQLYNNNAASLTDGSITDADVTINVTAGEGALFPAAGGGDFFLATLIGLDANGIEDTWEIVKCTSRTVDALTVVRAQESTTNLAWGAGTRIENRVTAGTAGTFLTSANDLSDVASASTARTNLGVSIGVDVEAYDATILKDIDIGVNIQAHSAVLDATTHAYTTADDDKLIGIAVNANNYVHPANHSPSIITQDSSNRFVTDAEKSNWNTAYGWGDHDGVYLPIGGGTLTGNLEIAQAGPAKLTINQTNATADEGIWNISAATDTLTFYAVKDDEISAMPWLNVTRTGYIIDNIAFESNVSGSGDLILTGNYSEAGTYLSAKYLGIAATAANSSLLGGAAASDVASNSTIVKRTSSGYIYANYLNFTGTYAATPTYIPIGIGDNFMRWQTIATFISNINLMEKTGGTFSAYVSFGGTGNPNPAARIRHLRGKAAASDTDDTLYINYGAAGKGVMIGDTGTDHPLAVYGQVYAYSEIRSTHTQPTFTLWESDAAADNRQWSMTCLATVFYFRALNDASSTASTLLGATRSGSTVVQAFTDATHFSTGVTSHSAHARLQTGDSLGIGGAVTANAIGSGDLANRCIQISTDTVYGGTYDDHTGFRIWAEMPGGWTTAELHFQHSSNWGTYSAGEDLMINYLGLTVPYYAGTGNRYIQTTAAGLMFPLTSDLTLKKNIRPCDYGLKEVLQMKPIRYNWIDEKHFGPEDYIGFGAQDIQELIPELVSIGTNKKLSLNLPDIVVPLTRAIQELHDIIKVQQDRIEQLEAV